MEELVWSTGEKYEKSFKKDNPNLIMKRENTELNDNTGDNNGDNNNGDNNNGDNNNGINMNNEIFRINNKREEANHKLSERHLIGQLNQNPFMINNDYIKDLDIQQSFLIPKNSNIDKNG
jgi:hypothetical protein